MHVHLFSEDRELYLLCREILSDMGDEDWTVSVMCPGDTANGSDLTLLDYDPKLPLPEDASSNPSKQLFLVDRKDLPAFLERTGTDDGQVLLKPVTRATL